MGSAADSAGRTNELQTILGATAGNPRDHVIYSLAGDGTSVRSLSR